MPEITTYTEKEAAEKVGCGVRHLADLARAQKIPYTKIGRGRTYTAEQVAAILAMHAHEPAAARPIPARRRSA